MENAPLDLLYPVLGHLDRHDLVNTALVSSTFNRVAIPLLYRVISSRISEEKVHIGSVLSFSVLFDSNYQQVLLHPCTTLLQRPELAQYVRKVTETGILS